MTASSELRIIRVFVSSPSDVKAERAVLDEVIDAINRTDGQAGQFRLQLFRWEGDVAPQVGPRPQRVVDSQTPPYHIYLGIMSTRFGTPTGRHESGTVKEFHEALKSWKQSGTPWIAFYFNAKPELSGDPDEAEQFVKVCKFKKSLEKQSIFAIYTGVRGSNDAFFEKISTHLRQIIPQLTSTTPNRTRYILVISGTIEGVDIARAEGLVAHLRKLAGDTSLTLHRIEEGSIKLILEGSRDGFEKLLKLHEQGALARELGVEVLSLNWEERIPNRDPTAAFRETDERIKTVAASVRPRLHKRFWAPRRNPHFHGRQQELEQIHDKLISPRPNALGQVIIGMGGIGKTQAALEYAHRYRDEYQAVLWVQAESKEALTTGFRQIADHLQPHHQSTDEVETVHIAQDWLATHDSWLLILDNADDPDLVADFLPQDFNGHLLLTSRVRVFGTLGIDSLALDVLPVDEAVSFLFSRAYRSQSDTAEVRSATELAKEVGSLPLALEQAAAYVLTKTMSFTRYLELFRSEPLEMLKKRGSLVGNYPNSVATTWSINFEALEEAHQDVLRMSAFLAPEPIPLKLIGDAGQHLGKAIGQALKESVHELLELLHRYSLISLDMETESFSVHRLILEVTRDSMGLKERRKWARRSLHAVFDHLPSSEDVPLPHRLVPHAKLAIQLVDDYNFTDPDIGKYHLQLGDLLRRQQDDLDAALRHYEKGLELCGPITPPLRALQIYRRKADLHRIRQEYDEALNYYQQAELSTTGEACDHNEICEKGKLYSSLADFYRVSDAHRDLDTALRYGEESLALHQSIPDNSFEVFQSHRMLMDIYFTRGDDKAGFEQAAKALAAIHDNVYPQIGWIHRSIGMTHLRQRDFSKAIESFSWAAAIFDQFSMVKWRKKAEEWKAQAAEQKAPALIGIATSVTFDGKSDDPLAALEFARQSGFEVVQIYMTDRIVKSESFRSEIRTQARNWGLRLICHAPGLITDARSRDTQYIDAAKHLLDDQQRISVVHHFDERRDADEIVRAAKGMIEAGIRPCIENYHLQKDPRAATNSCLRFIEIFELLRPHRQDVSAVFDIARLYDSQLGFEPAESEELVRKVFGELGRLEIPIILHLVDAQDPFDRSSWCPIGEGSIPYERIFNAIPQDVQIEAVILEFEDAGNPQQSLPFLRTRFHFA